jgi:hypothetical protein
MHCRNDAGFNNMGASYGGLTGSLLLQGRD